MGKWVAKAAYFVTHNSHHSHSLVLQGHSIPTTSLEVGGGGAVEGVEAEVGAEVVLPKTKWHSWQLILFDFFSFVIL